ncbi:PAS domain-containing protein [Actinoplanes sp. KI2]|uniref:PAS domain-containing protein n=1 Tax=Actinoplanes sp. KI2 TaxID=2983315 RepID=UPI0021D59B60|nr:PAS domain-containing protein [Actinoplanes sp. KI2]MCU7728814.1 PAS domain-containing protein [Actinoplanes sp. KI2]
MSRAIEWILLGSGSCLAIGYGVRRHRPSRVSPWSLLAGSVAAKALSDFFFAIGALSASEVCDLAIFVLVAATLLQFTRAGSALVDRGRLIDLLACACSALLVLWIVLVGDNAPFGHIPPSDFIGDLLLVLVAARLVVAAGRNAAAALLLAGSVGMLVSDLVYPLAPSPIAETGYIVLYVAWGLAALPPSMTRLTRPMPSSATPWRGHWAALLGAAVATPPAVLLIEALTGTVRDGVVIAIAGGLTLLLAITRLADSISRNSQAASRERALRTASGALVAAADLPAVEEAVHAAVAQLMPASTVRGMVFATDDRKLTAPALPAASPASPAVSPEPSPRSWWADESGEDDTLVCPLWLEPMEVARPNGGALIVTARREVLAATRDALETLAGQAAMALDRITLVEAVGRRDSDQYLRTVIGNTADLMLVIDDDQRIRYASPAVHDLLGDDTLSPLATLTDLVHPDDRDQVQGAFQSTGDGTLFCSLRRADQSQILVEATYRDLREDRLVRGYVVTMRNVTDAHDPDERQPHHEHVDELPAWSNRRSARHKFRY